MRPSRQELFDAFNARGEYSVEERGGLFRGDALYHRGREIGQLEFWPAPEAVIVSRIIVEPMHRGKGHGRGAMRQLAETADCLGLTLALTPDSSFGGSVPRLKKFYKGFGFIENHGRRADHAISESMYRLPRSSGCRR